MHVRCPRCDEDEYLGYSLCSRCGLNFEEVQVVEASETNEVNLACESCDVEGFLGHRYCSDCGRALEPGKLPSTG